MEDLKTKVKDIAENVGEIVDTYRKLAVVKTVEKSAAAISSVLTIVVILFLSIFFLFFIGLAAAIWVGNLLDNVIAGYLIVAGFYLLLILLLIGLKKKIIFPFIARIIIRKVYE